MATASSGGRSIPVGVTMRRRPDVLSGHQCLCIRAAGAHILPGKPWGGGKHLCRIGVVSRRLKDMFDGAPRPAHCRLSRQDREAGDNAPVGAAVSDRCKDHTAALCHVLPAAPCISYAGLASSGAAPLPLFLC